MNGPAGSYRELLLTPIFSDGANLCVISRHYIKSDSEAIVIQGELRGQANIDSEFVLEMYNADTWEFSHSVKLDFTTGFKDGEQEDLGIDNLLKTLRYSENDTYKTYKVVGA